MSTVSEENTAFLVGAAISAVVTSLIWVFLTVSPSPQIKLKAWSFDCYATHVEKYGDDPVQSRELCDAYIRHGSLAESRLRSVGNDPVVRELK